MADSSPFLTRAPVRAAIAVVVAALTAVLGVVMFPPYDGAEAAYVWLVPLALWLSFRPGGRRVWLVGFAIGWVHWAVLLAWLRHSPSAVDLPGAWALGWGMVLALAAVVAIFFAGWVRVAAWLIPRVREAKFPIRLLGWAGLAGLWILLEWIRGWLFTGFPWLPLAASQWQRPLVLQILSVTGVAGLSFLLVYFNLAVAHYLRALVSVRRAKWWERLSPDFYSALGLLAVAIFAGLNAFAGRADPRPLVRAAFIQPDIPPAQRWDQESAQFVTRLTSELMTEAALVHTARETDDWLALYALTPGVEDDGLTDASIATAWAQLLSTEAGAPPITRRADLAARQLATTGPWPGDAEVILWPEVSLPVYAVADGALHEIYASLARITGRPALQGALTLAGEDVFNAVVLTAPQEAEATDFNVYRKQRLVPFGEFVPLADWVPWLSTVVPIPGSFAAGDETVLLDVRASGRLVRFAPLICYEDVYAGLARDGVRAGADAFFVATNNAWFGDHAGPLQHAAHAVLRAVETRRPVLRVGNAGWSGWIDEYGFIRWQMRDPQSGEMAFRGVDSVAVTRDPAWTRRQSGYVQAGDWMVALGSVLFIVSLVLAARRAV